MAQLKYADPRAPFVTTQCPRCGDLRHYEYKAFNQDENLPRECRECKTSPDDGKTRKVIQPETDHDCPDDVGMVLWTCTECDNQYRQSKEGAEEGYSIGQYGCWCLECSETVSTPEMFKVVEPVYMTKEKI